MENQFIQELGKMIQLYVCFAYYSLPRCFLTPSHWRRVRWLRLRAVRRRNGSKMASKQYQYKLILVHRGHLHLGQHQESRPLAGVEYFELAKSTHFSLFLYFNSQSDLRKNRGWPEVVIPGAEQKNRSLGERE